MPNSLVRIPIDDTDSIVSLEIHVSGLIIWQLMYTSEDGTYYRGTNNPKGNTILLGKADVLVGDTDIWKLAITSPDNKDQKGEITLTWLENGATKARWERELDTANQEYGGMGIFIKEG